ncbi:GAF domain-containing protein [Halobaculum sp. MBLA0143]|uniref:GAF domain-containing protein n=1 Tax=Halobaculum sp. MBLA0143 TaxID=3079933 RepID=UPI0035231733
MADPIRVLHVDDDAGFADLAATLLERVDDAVTVETETTAEDGLARLDDGESFDCVVSDYDMPGLDGIEFLERVREREPDLPFLLFTGKGSESIAGEAISAGATDYLQKDSGTEQYELLANRIVNAVEQYRASRRASASRRRYSAMFEYATDAVAWTEFDGDTPVIQEANPAFEETFGDGSPLVGRPLDEIVADPRRRGAAREVSREVTDGNVIEREVTRDTPDGPREFLLRAVPVDAAAAEVTASFALYTDISEQKRRERQLEALGRQTTALLDTTSPVETARVAVETSETVLGASLCGVHLLSADGQTLRGVAATDSVYREFGETPDYDRDEDSVASRLIWRVFDTGEPVVIDDTTADPALSAATDVGSAIVYPLGDHGVLVVSAPEPGAFDATDEFLTDVLAASLRTALDQVSDEARLRAREAELAASRDRFRALFDNLTQPTVEIDFETGEPIVVGVNEAFESVFGYDGDRLVDESLNDHLVPDEESARTEATALDERTMAGERVERVEVSRETATGTREFLLQTATYDDGAGGFATYVDVTDDRRYERKLTALNEFAAALADAGSVDEIYERTVAAAADTLAFDWCVLTTVADGAFRLQAASEGAPQNVDEYLLDPDQGLAGRTVETGDSYITSDTQGDGRADPVTEAFRSGLTVPVGDDGVFQAISAEPDAFDETDLELAELLCAHAAAAVSRRSRERELERQNERLDRFADVVTHDLRSPLNAAAGRVELARETGDDEHLAAAQRALDRSGALVDNVLALAREGTAVTEPEPVDLADAAREAWETTTAPGTRLRVQTDRVVRADRSRLCRLLENLLRNAAEHGGETVCVTDTPTGFAVEDDGPGVPAAERDRVFESGYSTDRDGTGFGLAIVSEIADAHGWEIRLAEGGGGGARFEIDGVAFVG